MQSKECHHPIENEKSFSLMSNMTRYDEMKNKLRTIKNVVSNGVLHHRVSTDFKTWSVMVSCTIVYRPISKLGQ